MSTGLIVSVATAVITLAVCGVIVWVMFSNMRKQAWKGIVISKSSKEIEGASDFSSTSYFILVKLDNGTQKNIRVGRKIWEQFKAGDRIVKDAGKLNPQKPV